MATYTYTTSCTHHIELDLSAACPLGPNSIQDRMNDVVPGLKTSTGELISFDRILLCSILFYTLPSKSFIIPSRRSFSEGVVWHVGSDSLIS